MRRRDRAAGGGSWLFHRAGHRLIAALERHGRAVAEAAATVQWRAYLARLLVRLVQLVRWRW